MSGETRLSTLLASMGPQLCSKEYVFCTCSGSYEDYAHLLPIASFREKEGLSLVLCKQDAQANKLTFETVFSKITITAHSSLNAIGLTAAIATALAGCGISANVIAAFHHDHIFVPANHVKKAMTALAQLSDKAL